MSNYHAVINEQDVDFYTLIGRTEKSGEVVIYHGYKGRFFKTREAAEKSVAKYLAKFN